MTIAAVLLAIGLVGVLFAAAALDNSNRRTISDLENRLDDAAAHVAAALHRGAAEAARRHSYPQAAAWRQAAEKAVDALDRRVS